MNIPNNVCLCNSCKGHVLTKTDNTYSHPFPPSRSIDDVNELGLKECRCNWVLYLRIDGGKIECGDIYVDRFCRYTNVEDAQKLQLSYAHAN